MSISGRFLGEVGNSDFQGTAIQPAIVVIDAPSEDDRNAVLEHLRTANTARAGSANLRTFAILLQGGPGHSLGGVWGYTAYGWMFIQYLAISEAYRGQGLGKNLMASAEELARNKTCTGIWLDTYSFQAPGFYEMLGYSVFGRIDDYPVGHHRLFLLKRL
jgi:ribosomal protein S18 acetylase RimI-like enzyme